LFFQFGHDRLQGHAALGARARADLQYFGVHRAGVFGAVIDGRRLAMSMPGIQISAWLGIEFFQTALAAEKQLLTGMADLMRAVGFDRHATNRVTIRWGLKCGMWLIGVSHYRSC